MTRIFKIFEALKDALSLPVLWVVLVVWMISETVVRWGER